MANTTNIDDLPNSDENIHLVTQPQQPKYDANLQEPATKNVAVPEVPQKPISSNSTQGQTNEFVTGIQQAAATGALELPSRDIPLTQDHITNDVEAHASYIPSEPQYYIQQPITQQIKQDDSLDKFYDNLQTPIILAVLYFIFQLPIVKSASRKYIPLVFANDGNMNLSGYLIHSFLFAIVYYIIEYSLKYFSL